MRNGQEEWIAAGLRHLRYVFLALALNACGHGAAPEPEFPLLPISMKQKTCAASKATNQIQEVKFLGKRYSPTSSFGELRDLVNSTCKNCHMAPSQSKGITYIDSYQGEERSVNGEIKFYPGFVEMAEKFSEAIFSSDPKKKMPPETQRRQNPEMFLTVGRYLNAWIAAGKPEGAFKLPDDANGPALEPAPFLQSSEVGDCIPDPSIIGFDIKRDRAFETMEKLPTTLIDTDLFSLDAFELAQKGTVAYNVEYPLWADNAEKGRWVHVPLKREGDQWVRQTINFDKRSGRFTIPPNTRFYKNFYKLVKQANGKTSRYRRVETRIIVVREDWKNALFGTYRWDDSEQVATLVEVPYRDGTSFKDVTLPIVTNEKTGETRTYAIPGRQRCTECHMGSDSKSFVLGFTPLQINRRSGSEYARIPKLSADELSLADRLSAYNVISGITGAGELPRLENLANARMRNLYEFKAQAYMVGNCAHCHNPDGYAFAPGNDVRLDLTAGNVFGMSTSQRSVHATNKLILDPSGQLDASFIFAKVNDTPAEQGLYSRMPLSTPGAPDCEAVKTIGRWVRSLESLQAAEEWIPPKCKSSDNSDWVLQDFTWPKSDHYVPRRADWNDPATGMPEKFRALRFTEDLQKMANRQYAVDYWNPKPECNFPVVNLPPEQQRPWMTDDDGKPYAPYGEIYSTTPGSWFFRTTCFKCHGPNADGNTGLARGILNWSGGDVRVADLIHDLFGNNGENLKTFDVQENGQTRNLGGNYLVWMAMEGTRVTFPSQANDFLGKHGAQMLNMIRDKCLRQISPTHASKPIYGDHEVFRDVCFLNNLSPGDPLLEFDFNTAEPKHPEAVEEWLDRAAYNAGFMIFQFLKDAGQGNWRPGNDQCEKVFPKN